MSPIMQVLLSGLLAHRLARGLVRALPLVAALITLALPVGLGASASGAAWAAASGTGEQLFAQHCSGCHIHGGNVIRRGKTLKLAALQRQGIEGPEAIAAIATAGVGQMGGYGAVLGQGGAEAVADYVWQQALAGWPRV